MNTGPGQRLFGPQVKQSHFKYSGFALTFEFYDAYRANSNSASTIGSIG